MNNIKEIGQINPSPEISVVFKTLARTAVQRSALGILCIVLKDSKWAGDKWITVKNITDIKATDVESKTFNLIQLATKTFSPKTIMVRVQGKDELISEVLSEVNLKKINWLACPNATSEEDALVVTWIKQVFGTTAIKKTIKYVSSYATNTDHVAVVELDNKGVYKSVLGEFTAQEYTVAIAGTIAGCPLNRSLDNIVMADLLSVEDIEPKVGKLSLYNDDGVVRVNYAVNSKTTFDDSWKKDTRKIKVVEGMCLVVDDIRDTFKNYWLGIYLNNYDNKMAFCSNVTKVYFKELTPDVLDSDYRNYIDVDLEAQKKAVILDGLDPDEKTELEIRKYPTSDEVYLTGDVRFSDTMANLNLQISM